MKLEKREYECLPTLLALPGQYVVIDGVTPTAAVNRTCTAYLTSKVHSCQAFILIGGQAARAARRQSGLGDEEQRHRELTPNKDWTRWPVRV